MAHAGPDGLDIWTSGEMGLAVASFHTVPEQVAEPAPLVQGDLAIAFDGRIDNRKEIRRACAGHGISVAAKAGDAAHVLAAYRLYGKQVAQELIGEHAFVLWDGREHRVLGVRDHVGVRSLRWWSDGRTLIACSHFAPILAHPDVRVRPNEGMVAEWLCDRIHTIDESLWDGVFSVPGGGQLSAGRGLPPRVTRYWRPQDEIGTARIRREEEARELLVELTTEAVRCRLRAVGHPLVELSGGWDSSTVAVVAHDLHAAGAAQDFNLFSALYPGLSCDESPWIEAVEQRLSRTAIKQPQHVADPARNEAAVRRLRHPWAIDWLRNLPATPERRVALTGDGGNTVLGGMCHDLVSLLDPRTLRRAAARDGRRTLWRESTRPWIRPLLPQRVRASRQPPPPPWVSPALLRRVAFAERIAAREPLPSRGDLRDRALVALLDSSTFHLQDLLGGLERGRYVEYRNPLLDVRLVKLAIALPSVLVGTVDTDPRRLHDAAFGASLPAVVRSRRFGTDFMPFVARGMRAMREHHRGCPRLVQEGWLVRTEIGPIDDFADTQAGLWRARLAYCLHAWWAP